MELQSKFSVVLKADLPATEFELLQQFSSHRVLSQSGKDLLHFDCTKIDISHHQYLKIDSFTPGNETTDELLIPHHYVLLISGGEDRRPIGLAPD